MSERVKSEGMPFRRDTVHPQGLDPDALISSVTLLHNTRSRSRQKLVCQSDVDLGKRNADEGKQL